MISLSLYFHFLPCPCAIRTANPLPLSHFTSPPPPCTGYRRRELCSPSASAAVVTTATSLATSRSPMNYVAWKPFGNTRIIPTPSTHTRVPVHTQAPGPGQGTLGQVTRFIHWPIQQVCLPQEELEEDPRTVTAIQLTLDMVPEMGVEMAAQHPHRQRKHSEEAKCPHHIQVSICQVLAGTVTTWDPGITQPST